MKSNVKSLLGFLSLGLVLLTSCDSNVDPMGNINDPDAPKGSLSMSITDAPIDASEVSAVFITIAEIKVDGQKFEGFQGPKTVNVLQLQNGNTLSLGNSQVASGSYTNVELLIDSEKDATSSGPGCYIMKTDGTKERLELSGNNAATLTLKPKDFKVTENGTTELVMDFDLRKAIKTKGNGDYSFVTMGQLTSAVRAENKSMTGSIKGKIENYNSMNADLVVYVYNKGKFNENAETNNNNEVKYANAITSAKVDGSGNFVLSFLPEGNYEIVCEKPSKTLGLDLGVLLQLQSNADIKNIGVNAGAQTNVNASVK